MIKTWVLAHLLHASTLHFLIKSFKLIILEHYLQNIFFSKCTIKCLATDKISAQVLFFLKVKNEMFSWTMMSTPQADILTAADILPLTPQYLNWWVFAN